MRLTLNHDYRYAVEQMAFTLFPDERFDDAHETAVDSALHFGAVWVTARTKLTYGGTAHVKARRVPLAALTGGLETDRLLQRVIKLSFYAAGVEALGGEPPWGALTGVRPAKLAARLMRDYGTAAARQTLIRQYHVSPARAELALDCARAAEHIRAARQPGDIGLYIGIPFCPTRCAYCSFVSADVTRTLSLVEPFLQALLRELAAAERMIAQNALRVTSVYIGGGTPTTLSAAQLTRLLSALRRSIDLTHCTELTVEAGRPDTITADKLSALRAGGADRISVNPQTMHDPVLAAIGRSHTTADTLRAWDLTRTAGFSVRNMDLIAGLPGDSAVGFSESLDAVLALAPENVTIHTLARKRGAELGKAVVGDIATMLDYAHSALCAAGYAPYYLYRQKFMSGSFENIGWCKPSAQSAYNIVMMEELCSVLALGGGGVTKLVNTETGEIHRLNNPKYPKEYIETIDTVIARKEELIWPIS